MIDLITYGYTKSCYYSLLDSNSSTNVMKTKSFLVGFGIVFILWVCFVAYEKAQYESKLNAPQPLPSKIVTPPFPNGNCPTANCKG